MGGSILGVEAEILPKADSPTLTRYLAGQIEAAQSAGIQVRRVRLQYAQSRDRDAKIIYELAVPDVVVTVERAPGGKDPDDGLMAILARHAKTVARHQADAGAPRTIGSLDAVLVRLLRAHDALRRVAAARHKPLTIIRMRLGGNRIQETATPSRIYRSFTNTAGAHAHIEVVGSRVNVTVTSLGNMPSWQEGGQAIQNGCLLVATKARYPDMLIAAMRGRGVDEVVGGTALAGSGLVIAKAWLNGGRLGLSFVNERMPVATLLTPMAA